MSNYERQDHLYKAAKSSGYRSRAAYKLKELQKRSKVIKRGDKVLDLGAWPGSWSQVALELTGKAGAVAAIDLKQIDPIDQANFHFKQGDACEIENLQALMKTCGGRFDVVLSDMSPKLTGIKFADRAAIEGIAELALWAATQSLRTGGNFALKVFKCSEIDNFYRSNLKLFDKLKRVELSSTRKSSNEYYIVGIGFKDEHNSSN